MKDQMSRRKFIEASAVAGAAVTVACASSGVTSYKRIIGANDRIRIGQIGCGSRGTTAHMPGIFKHAKETNIEVIAVADPYRLARENANAKAKEMYGREARMFVSHTDLLALKDVDAVMIASCDHAHEKQLLDAALAKKDIYVEKPIGRDFEKTKKAVDAVNAAGVVCQVGTQLRSMGSFTGCRELWKTGILGTVGRIEQSRNSERPFWYSYMNKDVKKEDVDWNEFLMGLDYVPFDPVLYSGWYGYRKFSDGPVPQWGVHYIDLVHYITGCSYPTSCMCMGDTYVWKDENKFDAPEHQECIWKYPEGFIVNYSTNMGNGFGNSFKAYGDQGVLKMDHWSEPVYTAEGGSKNKGVIRGENKVQEVEHPDHFLDWLQCLRTRKQPNASIEAGYQHAVAVIMGTMSMDSGKGTKYDHAKREISFA